MTRDYQPSLTSRAANELYREARALRAENERFRRALSLVRAPPTIEDMHDATHFRMARLFAARVLIADRALRGEPFEVAPEPETSVEGSEQGSGAPQPAEVPAPESQGMEAPHEIA